MDLLAVTKPLFNGNMDVEGYYFSFQRGNAILENVKSNPLDGAMDLSLFEFMNSVGLEALTYDKQLFVPVTNIFLAMDLDKICGVSREKVTLLLDKYVDLDAFCLERVKHYKELGFTIALRNYNNLEELTDFLPYADYVLMALHPEKIKPTLDYLRRNYSHIKLAAIDIASSVHFDLIKFSGIDLFDGNFYKIHIMKGWPNPISPLKVNYIQLLNVIGKDDFDLKEVTSIIQQDTALAIQFLKLVNSSIKINTEIKSVNHAAAMLGQREIKKWITTAVATSLSADKPSEITRVSLIRAKFCENLALYFGMDLQRENLFLMGLFSILDVILDLPMSDALELVFVPAPVGKALESQTGPLNVVYDFIKQYEQGNWVEVSRISLLYEIKIDDIFGAYVNSLKWYSDLINMVVSLD